MGFDVGSIEASASLNRDEFNAGIDDAIAKGEEFADSRYEATADIDDAPAEAKLAALGAEMDALGSNDLGGLDQDFEGLATDVEGAGVAFDDLSPKLDRNLSLVDSAAVGAERAGISYNDFATALQRGNLTLDDVADLSERLGVSTDDLAAGLSYATSEGSKLRPVFDDLESGALDLSLILPEAASGAEQLQGGLDNLATTVVHGADGLESYFLDAEAVISGLEGMRLVTRNAGGDLLDFSGNVTTTGSVLKSFGIVLDNGTISTVGLNSALDAFSREGLAETTSGLDAVADAGLAANVGLKAVTDAETSYQEGMLAAAQATVLVETGLQEMEQAGLDATTILEDLGLAAEAGEEDLAAIGGAALDVTQSFSLLAEAAGGGDGTGGASGGLQSAASSAWEFVQKIPVMVGLVAAAIPLVGALGGAAIGLAGALTAAAIAGTGGLGAFLLAAAGDLKQLHPEIVQIEDDWKSWSASFEPVVNSALLPWLDAVIPALKSLDPIIPAVGTEIQSLGTDFDTVVGGSGWTEFTHWIADEAPPSIDAFVKGLANIGSGIVTMGEEVTPVVSMLDRGWQSLTSDLDNFAASPTFHTFVSWLQANLPRIGTDFESLGSSVVKILASAAPLGVDMVKALADIASAVATAVHDVEDLVSWIGKVIDIGEELSGTGSGSPVSGLSLIGSAAKGASDGLGLVDGVLSGLVTDLFGASKPAIDTAAALDGLGKAGSTADSALSFVADTLDHLRATGPANEVWIKSTTQDISNLASTATSAFDSATSIVSAFGSQTSITGSQVESTLSGLVTQAGNFASNLQKAIEDGYSPQVIAQLLEAGPTQAGPILESLVSNASSSFVSMVNGSEAALTSISEFEIEQAKLTQTAIDSSSAKTTADYSTAMALLTQISEDGGKTSVTNLSTQLGIGVPEIERILTEYNNVFGGGMANIEGSATTGGSTAGSNLAGGLASKNAAVGQAAANLQQQVLGPFGGLYGPAYTDGQSASDGLAAGIIADAKKAVAAAASTASQVLQAIADPIAPGSPSKTTTVWGQSIPQGLAYGIDQDAGLAVAAAGSLTDHVLGALAPLGLSTSAPNAPVPYVAASAATSALVSSAEASSASTPSGSPQLNQTVTIAINGTNLSAAQLQAAVVAALDEASEKGILQLAAMGRRG